MLTSAAKPLKIPSSSPAKPSATSPTPTNEVPPTATSTSLDTGNVPPDITSPHELTAFVETVLDKLESRFDDMSNQILERMSQMSSRVDALEASIQDIINGDTTTTGFGVPQSPIPTQPTGGMRRSGST